MNLTKVRSATARTTKRVLAAAIAPAAIGAFAAASGAHAAPAPGPAAGAPAAEAPAEAWGVAGVAPSGPRLTIALLPRGIEPADLAGLGFALGLTGAGLGQVSAAQTYLDIGQGNRLFNSLYDDRLPPLSPAGDRVPDWGRIVRRAESAPADIVPGLLASTLAGAGFAATADRRLRSAALLVADRRGRIVRSAGSLACPERRCGPGLAVVPARVADLRTLARRLRDDDLLIAIERPPPEGIEPLATAIAGRGFNGLLTSDTTRTRGLVAATDVAPTIVARLGLPQPDELSGRPIRAGGSADLARLERLTERLPVVRSRRSAVVLVPALAWAALALAAIAAGRRRAAPLALSALALSSVYLPAVLLVTAALAPSLRVEQLIAATGPPALAGLTLAAVRGYAALALACAVTVTAQLVDVVSGSELTKMAVTGPNPALGVRFFGVGNELEAVTMVLVPVGVGAALAAAQGAGRRIEPRAAGAAFLAVGIGAAAVLAYGRFGADVGAAIVLPVGAVVAAAVAAGGVGRARTLALVAATPVVAVAALAVIDLVLGGDAHLTRSVFEAGGASDLADVAERRLTLSARSFTDDANLPYLVGAATATAIAIDRRAAIRAWFEGRRTALAGFAGAAAATAIGTVANDSGAVVLIVGTALVLTCAGVAWAQSPTRTSTPSRLSDPHW